jgi:hypothetical protein
VSDRREGSSEVTDEVAGREDLEAEAKEEDPTGKGEGLAEKVKEKGEELLDKVSGPDIPPSLSDEDRRR